MQSAVDDFLAMLKYNPAPYISNQGLQIATYSKVKTAIVLALYTPSNWPQLAQGFIEMLSGNFTGFFDIASSWYAGPDDGDDDISAAITCGEQAFRADSVQGLKPLLDAITASSKFGGLDFGTDNAFACSGWKQKAKEVYSGNFRVKPRSPVLFVGNTYDPVTPLASALNTSAGFEGSVVLQHKGYGVCHALSLIDLEAHGDISILQLHSLHYVQQRPFVHTSTTACSRPLDWSVSRIIHCTLQTAGQVTGPARAIGLCLGQLQLSSTWMMI